MSPPNRLDGLTGLRYVAAATVALNHMPHLHVDPLYHEVLSLASLRGGLITLFFVLSGFVLAYRYRRKLAHPTRDDLRDYYRARLARIWPVHLFALGLALILPVAPVPGGVGPFVANFFLVHAWVPSPEYFQSYDSVSWTLSQEAFFHLMLPVLVWTAARRALGPKALLAVAAFAWLAALALVFRHARHPNGWSLYLCVMCPAVRLGEFVVGVCMGLAFARQPSGDTRRTHAGTALELAALIPVAALAALASRAPGMLAHNGLFTPALAVFVWVVARQRGGVSAALGRPVLVYLGNLSFPVYLLHPFVIIGFDRWLGPEVAWPLGRAALMLGATTLAAAAVHHALEVPAQRWFGPKRRATPAIVAERPALAA